jgi:hypothetical protein
MLEPAHGHGHHHGHSHSYGEDQLQAVGRSLELSAAAGAAAAPSLGAGGGSRPTSGRYKTPVFMMVDAVRSKEEQQVMSMLAYLEAPGSTSGGEGTRTRVPGINDRHPVTGRTALNEAVVLGQTAIVRILLQAGADPNVPHRTNGPPIMHCAASGETELMELLLAYQAQVNVCDISGAGGGPAGGGPAGRMHACCCWGAAACSWRQGCGVLHAELALAGHAIC